MMWSRLYGVDRGKMSISPYESKATICLDGDTGHETTDNEKNFSEKGLIGRFRCLWPSLGDLDKWITDSWSPILDGNILKIP